MPARELLYLCWILGQKSNLKTPKGVPTKALVPSKICKHGNYGLLNTFDAFKFFVYKLQCFQGSLRQKKNVQRVSVLNLIEISKDFLIFMYMLLKITATRFDSEPSSGTQGRSVRPGEKVRWKSSSMGRSPWVLTLTGPFPNGQANAGSSLGTKNALYYCAQSANSFSWVLFVSSYTTAIISPQLRGSFTKLS